jgi:hypothetical protein
MLALNCARGPCRTKYETAIEPSAERPSSHQRWLASRRPKSHKTHRSPKKIINRNTV